MRVTLSLLLLAILAFGIGVVFLLPPFEGADETAHFSRVQASAFADQPVAGLLEADAIAQAPWHIARDVFDYYHRGPMPYGWITFAFLHANDPDHEAYASYHDFFNDADRMAAYESLYRHTPMAPRYAASPETNWEYQHPPLYYAWFGAVLRALGGHQSLVDNVLDLRLLSYVLAFAGFAVGTFGTWRYLTKTGHPDAGKIVALGLLYPFMMPSYFWEFARVGNDSLFAALIGLAWAMVLEQIRDPRGWWWVPMAVALALGCLTKGLVVPVAGGMIAFLMWHRFGARHGVDLMGGWAARWWTVPLASAALVLLFGAPIYVESFAQHGLVGLGEFQLVRQKTDAVDQLIRHFSSGAMLAGIEQIVFSAIWLFGTWSVAVIDAPFYGLLYGVVGAACLAYLVDLGLLSCSKQWATRRWMTLPIWLIAPVLMGLIAHVIVSIILQDTWTPGVYLHILAPAWNLVFGLGFMRLLQVRRLDGVILGAVAAIVILNFALVAAYATMFSGCAVPTPRHAHVLTTLFFLNPHDVVACFGQPDLVIHHLAILAWPWHAITSFVLAFIFLILAAGGYARACLRRQPQ